MNLNCLGINSKNSDMGIYIGCVFKNDFQNRKDKEATIAYLKKAMDILKDHYALSPNDIWLDIDDEDDRFSIEADSDALKDLQWISLCGGAWCVELSQKYEMLFHSDQDYLDMLKGIASVLGAKEMWICDDIQIWRGNFWIYNQNFSAWINYLEKQGFDMNKEYPSVGVLETYDNNRRVCLSNIPVYHVSLSPSGL